MCIYVTTPLSESASMLVIQKPSGTTEITENGVTYIKTGSATFFDEAYGHTNGPAYSSPTANIISNGVYASNGDHPTDVIVAYDGTKPVYMDQVIKVGASTAKVPETNVKRPVFAADGEGHVFGYGTCMWLRKCDQAGEVMGSACSATLSNVVYSGYCFTSDVGSLECGFLSASDDEYGEKPISFDVSVSPNLLPSVAGVVNVEGSAPTTTVVASAPGATTSKYRCPVGSPAKSLGSFVSKRPLSAGCMNPTDPSYSSLAEVHVPDYCTTVVDYKKGCMLPSAVNFDPTAKQVGVCKFDTKGCSSPTALNYNSLATLAPDAGKECIEPVYGCTVAQASYNGVDSNTPAFKSGFYATGPGGVVGSGGVNYGKFLETGGAVPGVYGGVAVAPTSIFNTNANVNSGCVIAVEGCMDSTAVNYDPLATVNSGTWCVPPVRGCMVPSLPYVASTYSNTEEVASNIFGETIDVPTASFAATTTLHDATMCFHGRYGCNETGFLNHDQFATIKTACYASRYGCLNPAAVNFGCPDTTFSSACTLAPEAAVTVHYKTLCKWTVEVSPPPPLPPAPPAEGYSAVHKVAAKFLLSGTVEAIQEKAEPLKAVFRNLAGLAEDAEVDLALTQVEATRRRLAEAVDVTMSAVVADADAANAAASSLTTSLGDSPASATAAMASAGVEVLSVPTVETEVTYVEADAGANGGLIGGIVGGIGGFLMLIGIAAFIMKRKNATKATYPA